MVCEPTELLIFADWLYKTKKEPPDSVLLRTIINRAYYAALIAARDYTQANTAGNKGHGNVVDALRKVSSHAANSLNAMRLSRQNGDYELDRPVTIRDALKAIEYSRSILYEVGSGVAVDAALRRNFLDSNKFSISPGE